MKKSELKTGMLVEYANKNKRMVLLNSNEGDILISNDAWADLENYTETLECKDDAKRHIVAVYENYNPADILGNQNSRKIWERQPETIEMTLEEACKKLRETVGKPVKITL
jgi:hypothetical protein